MTSFCCWAQLTEQGCSTVVSMCCEPIIEAIVCAINEWKLKEGKGANDQIPLMIEACRLAMITRWPGKHHLCFWKRGINKVLVDILMPNFVGKYPSYHTYPLEEQISIARENLIDNIFLVLRPYAWDILGWLVIRCAEDFDPRFCENEAHFDILTVATWYVFIKYLVPIVCSVLSSDLPALLFPFFIFFMYRIFLVALFTQFFFFFAFNLLIVNVCSFIV